MTRKGSITAFLGFGKKKQHNEATTTTNNKAPPPPTPPATAQESGESSIKSKKSSNASDLSSASAASKQATNLPPALSSRQGMKRTPSKPGSSLLERYWRLSDVLEDKNVTLSWRTRILIAYDVAEALKRLHGLSISHNRLFAEDILLDVGMHAKIKDAGSLSRSGDANEMKRDILFFGVILCQLSLHQTLDLGGLIPRRAARASLTTRAPFPDVAAAAANTGASDEKNGGVIDIPGIPVSDFKTLKDFFALELAGGDTSAQQDDFAFHEALSGEVRKIVGSYAPPAGENVPQSAIKSLEELAVQCTHVLAMNRPEADAVEDWLAAILDEVGGKALNEKDKEERDTVFALLESNPHEVMGDPGLVEESDIFREAVNPGSTSSAAADSSNNNGGDSSRDGSRGEGASSNGGGDDDASQSGYETDDSYQPPVKERRASRLSMFLDENKPADKVIPLKGGDDGGGKREGGSSASAAGGANKRRMSIKPTGEAMMTFMTKSTRKSLSGGVLTPYSLKKRFDVQERIEPQEAIDLLVKAEEVLREDPNLPVVNAPCTVVGDLHGQYYDMIHMLERYSPSGAKAAPSTNFLFLGDYVDRGDWSCEVLLFLLSLKVANPKTVTLIRGNHECDTVSSYFGFKEECERKYGRTVFIKALAVFKAMPVGAILETGGAGRFLCVHGGISPNVTSLEQFEKMNRFEEPGMNGFLCDVLWSDPIKDDFDDGEHTKSLGDFLSIDYVANPARGCSFRYGYSAIVSFLAQNRLVAIIRAHEVMQEGYRYHFQTVMGGAQKRIMPPVITVFSAPNYLGKYGNKGAVLKVDSVKNKMAAGAKSGGVGAQGFKPIDLLTPLQYDAVKSPVPLVLESEADKTSRRLEHICPYMPTTLETFIKTALLFNEGFYDEDKEEEEEEAQGGATTSGANEADGSKTEQGGESGAPMPRRKTLADAVAERTGTVVPEMEQVSSRKLDVLAKELRKMSMDGGGEGGVPGAASMATVDLLKGGLLDGADSTKRRNSLDELVKKKGISSLIAKFSQAAAVDGINEMHPDLVQAKMEEAKKKVDQDVPLFQQHQGRGNGSVVMRGNPRDRLVGGGGDEHRKTLVQPNNKRRTEAGAGAAANAKAAILAAAKKKAEEDKPKEVEVEFSSEEIVCLQTLFLMVDRDGDDAINVKEILAWSAADGANVGEEYARLTVEALDMDKDGHIGFQDYLSFAAVLKDYYSKHQKRDQSDDDGAPPPSASPS